MKFLLSVFILILTACSTSVKSNHETGSHQIRCLDTPSACYEKAAELCPDGYLITNRIRPYRERREKAYYLNIRCRGKITR